MSDFSAADVVGTNLTAAKQLTAYNGYPLSKSTFIIPNGQSAGTVYSWVMNGGNLYWQFLNYDGSSYYIKHESDAFHSVDLTNAGVLTEAEKAAAAAEDNKRQDMGDFLYYTEKWGGTILKYGLLTVAGIAVVKIAVNAKTKT